MVWTTKKIVILGICILFLLIGLTITALYVNLSRDISESEITPLEMPVQDESIKKSKELENILEKVKGIKFEFKFPKIFKNATEQDLAQLSSFVLAHQTLLDEITQTTLDDRQRLSIKENYNWHTFMFILLSYSSYLNTKSEFEEFYRLCLILCRAENIIRNDIDNNNLMVFLYTKPILENFILNPAFSDSQKLKVLELFSITMDRKDILINNRNISIYLKEELIKYEKEINNKENNEYYPIPINVLLHKNRTISDINEILNLMVKFFDKNDSDAIKNLGKRVYLPMDLSSFLNDLTKGKTNLLAIKNITGKDYANEMCSFLIKLDFKSFSNHKNTSQIINVAKSIMIYKIKHKHLPAQLSDLPIAKEEYIDAFTKMPFLYSAENGILTTSNDESITGITDLVTKPLTFEEICTRLETKSYNAFALYLK